MVNRRRLSLILVVVVATLVIGWSLIRPSHDRPWIVEQSVLPRAEIVGSVVRLHDVRQNRYTARETFTPAWGEMELDLNKLESAWFILTPFAKDGWRGPAHVFVSFGFSDSQYVAISVEARREQGERYGVLAGLFKQYEMMYVVGDERDLIGQRAAFGESDVYLYPIRATPERIRAVFVEMLERVNELHERPEFYHSLFNNCTSNLIAHVNQVAPGRIPAGWKTVVPGYTDEVAIALGLLDTELSVEEARVRFRVNEVARRVIEDSSFSVRIRGGD